MSSLVFDSSAELRYANSKYALRAAMLTYPYSETRGLIATDGKSTGEGALYALFRLSIKEKLYAFVV